MTARPQFGVMLKRLMDERGIGPAELQRRSGVKHSNISAIAAGRKPVGAVTAARLADALKLDADTRNEFLNYTRDYDAILLDAIKAELAHIDIGNCTRVVRTPECDLVLTTPKGTFAIDIKAMKVR